MVGWAEAFCLPLSLNMNDIQEMCQKNATSALAVGRRDVAKVTFVFFHWKASLIFCAAAQICPTSVQVWALASAATSQDLSPDSDPDTETPWARHPFGRHLLETLWVSVLCKQSEFHTNV